MMEKNGYYDLIILKSPWNHAACGFLYVGIISGKYPTETTSVRSDTYEAFAKELKRVGNARLFSAIRAGEDFLKRFVPSCAVSDTEFEELEKIVRKYNREVRKAAKAD